MTDENSEDKMNITRRHMLAGMASIPALAMMGGALKASDYPTAAVNTSGLAVTDDTVTVGILHSITGTMAISETGSVQAEKLAIEQINASGGVLGRQIEYIQEDGGSDWPTLLKKPKSFWCRTKLHRLWVVGHQHLVKRCCRCSNSTMVCFITRRSMKAWSSLQT